MVARQIYFILALLSKHKLESNCSKFSTYRLRGEKLGYGWLVSYRKVPEIMQ